MSIKKSISGTLGELIFYHRKKINEERLNIAIEGIHDHMYQDVLDSFKNHAKKNYNPHYIVKFPFSTISGILHSTYWEDTPADHPEYSIARKVYRYMKRPDLTNSHSSKLVLYVIAIFLNMDDIMQNMTYYFMSGIHNNLQNSEKKAMLVHAIRGSGSPTFYTRLSVFFYLLYHCSPKLFKSKLTYLHSMAEYKTEYPLKGEDNWLPILPSSKDVYDKIRHDILNGMYD